MNERGKETTVGFVFPFAILSILMVNVFCAVVTCNGCVHVCVCVCVCVRVHGCVSVCLDECLNRLRVSNILARLACESLNNLFLITVEIFVI
mmetsp:Transcript_1856/g.3882  ORF Transcript_1856/g.3882 Transcript_1856/m.3882 type:complete len:92 (+) Transcript_1856:1884-2159(+)